RDRDILVAGPVAREMGANFEAFWQDPRSVPPSQLVDVGGQLLEKGVPPPPEPEFALPQRVMQVRSEAGDPARIDALAQAALPVADANYSAGLPGKHDGVQDGHGEATGGLRGLIESAEDVVLLQTPYLVLSGPAQDVFRSLHRREGAPRVIVSTISLAATAS